MSFQHRSRCIWSHLTGLPGRHSILRSALCPPAALPLNAKCSTRPASAVTSINNMTKDSCAKVHHHLCPFQTVYHQHQQSYNASVAWSSHAAQVMWQVHSGRMDQQPVQKYLINLPSQESESFKLGCQLNRADASEYSMPSKVHCGFCWPSQTIQLHVWPATPSSLCQSQHGSIAQLSAYFNLMDSPPYISTLLTTDSDPSHRKD